MPKRQRRVRIMESGELEIVDPDLLEDLPLLTAVDPGFVVAQSPLPGFTEPRLLRTRSTRVALPAALDEMDTDALWDAHDRALLGVSEHAGCVSLLDIKIEIARRLLQRCSLCAHRCSVNRLTGERGRCLLGPEARVIEHFTHIGEEPPINPSYVLSLEGCGLRCRFCQQHALLVPGGLPSDSLDEELWRELDLDGARSLTFVGGNPDESLYAILRFLRTAPVDWHLPVVWNNHAYSTREVLRLLDGVVDAYVPDFKFGSDACAHRLSGAVTYTAVANGAIAAMLAQSVPVFVRILVLPEHNECCHLPTLELLARMVVGNLVISLRDQYSPDHRTAAHAGTKQRGLARRVAAGEIAAVQARIDTLGLMNLTTVAATCSDERIPQPQHERNTSTLVRQGDG